MPPYLIFEKAVGQTPLDVLEDFKATHPEYQNVPLAYAGRLDPMASGKLLVLVGDECKRQTDYHALDKEYVVEILFGVSSDSGDVLGITQVADTLPTITPSQLTSLLPSLRGAISLPYPKFSSKTVQGKPLHTWTVEGRIDEIEIPTYTASIHRITLDALSTKTRAQVYKEVSVKIETIPPVTDPKKALGNDFRRPEVRASWSIFAETGKPGDAFTIARIRCTGSSGLYMRTLAEVIARHLGTTALAYSIHRSKMGIYTSLPFGLGYWRKQY